MKKPMSIEEILCGLSMDELEGLIKLCCTEGEFSHKVHIFHLSREDSMNWKHKILGIKLNFRSNWIMNGMLSDFKLSGKGWSLNFSGVVSINTILNEDEIPMRIGPIHETIQSYKVYHFYHRGDIQKFKHDMSLLRMML